MNPINPEFEERVFCVDPGEKVGWCYVAIDKLNHSLRVADHGITDLKPFVLELFANTTAYDTIVYEAWRLRRGFGQQFEGSEFPSVQLIGMVRMIGWLNPHIKVVKQTPGQKKTGQQYARTRLPAVRQLVDNAPRTHDDAHDVDAVLHAAAYLFRSRIK